MIILGIDPGYATVGYGIIEYSSNHFRVIDYGAVITQPNKPFDLRLREIYDSISVIMDRHKPDAMSIEKLYFNTNTTTAIDVAQARGVIMLAAQQHSLSIGEFTPLQVKQSVVGYGRAEKKQVQEMTKLLLNLEQIPKPDDTADALAMAICYAHSNSSLLRQIGR